jgi:hypothetical protein
MKVKVKLVDNDLIRTFGGSTIIMTIQNARRYGSRVRILEEIEEAMMDLDEDKNVWIPPEVKMMIRPNELKNNPYPDHLDRLFPQIKGT